MLKIRNNKAFTLIEIVISILIFAIFLAVIAFFSKGFLQRQHLRDETSKLLSGLQKIQTNAKTGYLDDSWSVKIDKANNSYTFFKGESYSSRDQKYDEVIKLYPSVSFQTPVFDLGGDVLIFYRPYGATNQQGLITLQTGTYTSKITINGLGIMAVSY